MIEPIHVAIIGPSGSGKSWLARSLASGLGPAASYITLDNFYHDLSGLEPSNRSAVNFDDPAAIDWECVRCVMDGLSKGKTVEVPNYDFASHTRRPRWLQVAPTEWLIWDGLWLLHEPWLRERFGLSVFVNCEHHERLARRLARDVLERGRTADSVRWQFQEHVEPMGQKYVQPQRQWASCQVSSPITEADYAALLAQLRGLRVPA